MYTLDYDFSQLDRMQDRITAGQPIRIIHILTNDQQGLEDRYIVLVDCDACMYTMLLLL
jgi:hypothetical protein